MNRTIKTYWKANFRVIDKPPESIRLREPIVDLYAIGPGYGESLVVIIGKRIIFGVDCCHGLVISDPLSGICPIESICRSLPKSTIALWGITHPHYDHFQGIEILEKMLMHSLSRIALPTVFTEKELAYVAATKLVEGKATKAEQIRAKDEFNKFRSRILRGDIKGRVVPAVSDVLLFETKAELSKNKDYNLRISVLAPGFSQLHKKIGKAAMKLIGAASHSKATNNVEGGEGVNDVSAIFLVEMGPVKLLLTGDSPITQTTKALKRIRGFPGKWVVLKVGHHGSNDATDLNLLQSVWKPGIKQAAIVCPFNRSMLPNERVLNLLKSNNTNLKVTGGSDEKELGRLKARLQRAGIREISSLTLGARRSWRLRLYLESGQQRFFRESFSNRKL